MVRKVAVVVTGLFFACSKATSPTMVTPACTFDVTIDPHFPCAGGCSVGVGSSGGAAFFDVVAPATCAWTAASGVVWIRATPPAGTGGGIVMVSVIANPDSARVADVNVAGTLVEIDESGSRPCSYRVTPLAVSILAAGGAMTVDQGASSNGCSSTLSTNVDWITIPSPNVHGSAGITFSAAPNSGGTPRSGLLIVTPCQNTNDSDCETTGLLPPVSVTVSQPSVE